MGGEARRAATVYRRLLKAVDKHIGKDGGKGYLREFVSEEFRKNSALSDQEAARQKLKLASDYTYLINSVHHHKVISLILFSFCLFLSGSAVYYYCLSSLSDFGGIISPC
jgi:Complex 1 protein (LYR family)